MLYTVAIVLMMLVAFGTKYCGNNQCSNGIDIQEMLLQFVNTLVNSPEFTLVVGVAAILIAASLAIAFLAVVMLTARSIFFDVKKDLKELNGK